MSLYNAATDFMKWMDREVLFCGRGDNVSTLRVEPKGRFWLGRLASEEAVAESALGERGERLEPCAVGVRCKPAADVPWVFQVEVRLCVWLLSDGEWKKLPGLSEVIDVSITDGVSADYDFGRPLLEQRLTSLCGFEGLSSEVRVEARKDFLGQPELTILLVNTSSMEHQSFRDTNLYECSLEVLGLKTDSYMLESLPDSFRYDRRVPAYGVNCGIEVTSASIRTVTLSQ